MTDHSPADVREVRFVWPEGEEPIQVYVRLANQRWHHTPLPDDLSPGGMVMGVCSGAVNPTQWPEANP